MTEQNMDNNFINSELNDSVLILPYLPEYTQTQTQAQAFRSTALQRQLNHPIMEQSGDDDDLGLNIDNNTDLIIPPQVLENNDDNNNKEKVLTLTKKGKINLKSKNKQNKTRPAFVMKLWTMVNDKINQEYINWVSDGKSFLVANREMFVQKVLPKYFKHSNFASFVRQLNMYGWHKVQDANSGSLHNDEKWQFTNINFQKNKPELLDKIIRNKPSEDNEEDTTNQLNVGILLKELNTLKTNQLKITQELSRVRSDNELLWQELFKTREKNLLQNDKIEKILQFLASVYGNNAKQLAENFQGQHTLQDSSYKDSSYKDYEPDGSTSAQYIQQQSQQQQQSQSQSQSQPQSQPQPQPQSQSQSQQIDPEVYSSLTESPLKFKPRLMLKQQRHVSNPNTSLIDESPIEEIVRTPNEFNGYSSSYDQNYGNFLESTNTPCQMFVQNPTTNSLQQSIPQSLLMQFPQSSQLKSNIIPQSYKQNSEIFKEELKPKLNHSQSYKKLSKSVEQQGQDIDELINRLQQQQVQYEQRSNSSSSDSTTPSTSTLDQNFDLNEFLNNDILPYDDNNFDQGIKKRGTVIPLDDDGEVEEILNPNKKKKI